MVHAIEGRLLPDGVKLLVSPEQAVVVKKLSPDTTRESLLHRPRAGTFTAAPGPRTKSVG